MFVENYNMHNILFTRNEITKEWCAFHRDHSDDYYNNYKSDKVIRSSKLESLVALINKYETIPNVKKHIK